MALNLIKAGFSLTVWNRSTGKTAALEKAGASVAETPAAAVAGADVVITMVSDGPAVADLLFAQGVAEHIPDGATVIDMSSIKPEEARDHAAMLAKRGVSHIDAPVSGGTRGAAVGSLAIMAGGNDDAFARIATVFEPMGNAILLGPRAADNWPNSPIRRLLPSPSVLWLRRRFWSARAVWTRHVSAPCSRAVSPIPSFCSSTAPACNRVTSRPADVLPSN
nr:NAD(P)-binding domain-containing protein [Marinicella sp. W31]MDC2879957.1 NAD(P)-binding domain-containing protein [Marinicella sp. W31]